MTGSGVFVFLGVLAGWGAAQFLNNRPYPTYSLEQMPDTGFSCRDKILGGYYADPETQCQMFHVCVKVAGVGVQDFRFLCPNGTAFDQDHQICADWEDVDCDATTLYYSSDNFDLYRIGSGFESKAVKYGEDEEAFSLQRAETGDVRLNREHQTQRINQQKDYNFNSRANKQNNLAAKSSNNYNERDIFKGSSSSNFFNNRNGGKETEDDDYESGNVNSNQNEDRYQRRKTIRKQNRRPDYTEEQTQKPGRPTVFSNNFAGSSYIPTTARPTSTTDQSNYRTKQRGRVNHQYNNADNFRNNGRNYEDDGQYRENSNSQYTVSTPAPFRQNQQFNNYNRDNSQYNSNNGPYNQFSSTTQAPKPTTRSTENYPSPFTQNQANSNNQNNEPDNYPSTPFNNRNTQQQQFYNSQYEVTKTKQTENYPTQNFKKPTTSKQQAENYPTTFSPKTSPFKAFTTSTAQPSLAEDKQSNSPSTVYNQQQQYDNTRSTNAQFSYNQPSTNKQTAQYNPPTTQQKQTTQFTQYTPTVPRITTPYHSSTTPANNPRRSNRFDETQYDDGSYNSKYEYEDNNKSTKDDEFLKTAHSTNIASSRNEYLQSTRNAPVSTTQKPRPFSVTSNLSKATDYTKATSGASPSSQNLPKSTANGSTTSSPTKQSTANSGSTPGGKKGKDANYDYAYYDTNVGNEYDVGVDIEKSSKTSTTKQQ